MTQESTPAKTHTFPWQKLFIAFLGSAAAGLLVLGIDIAWREWRGKRITG